MPKCSFRGAALYALLRPIAAEVRTKCSSQAKMIGLSGADCCTVRDFISLSESCTYEAYRLIMRRAKKPLDDEQRAAIVARARLLIIREVQGRKSNFFDWRMRRGHRRDVGRRWSSWQTTIYTRATDESMRRSFSCWDHRKRLRCLPQDIQQVVIAQERAVQSEFREELETALRQVLTPVEHAVMAAHYLDGKPQREIARDMAEADGRYKGRKGLVRAETRVNVLLHRARARARKRLPAEWALRAADVA